MNCLHAAAWWTHFRVCGAWGRGCGRPGGQKAARVCTRLFPCHAPSAFPNYKVVLRVRNVTLSGPCSQCGAVPVVVKGRLLTRPQGGPEKTL